MGTNFGAVALKQKLFIMIIIILGTVIVLSKLWDFNFYRDDGKFIYDNLAVVKAEVERIDEMVVDGKVKAVVVAIFKWKEEDFLHSGIATAYIPGEKFYELPEVHSKINVNSLTGGLIVPNTGSKLITKITFELVTKSDTKVKTVEFEANCKLSGQVENPADIETLMVARLNLWQKWLNYKGSVRQEYKDSTIIFQKRELKTDRFSNTEYFTAHMESLALSLDSELPIYF